MENMKSRIERIYAHVSTQLKEAGYIEEILPMRLSQALSYYGQIGKISTRNTLTGEIKSERYDKIAMSVKAFNYMLQIGKYETQADLDLDIAETVCHEYAHMKFWNHEKGHARLTVKYLDYVKDSILSYTEKVAQTVAKEVACTGAVEGYYNKEVAEQGGDKVETYIAADWSYVRVTKNGNFKRAEFKIHQQEVKLKSPSKKNVVKALKEQLGIEVRL